MKRIVEGNKHQGHILHIGTFDAEGNPQFWAFDGSECDAAGLHVLEDGTQLLSGWSLDELRSVARNVKDAQA